MSLDEAQKSALRKAFARRPRAEAKRAFAAIRENPDETLLAALQPDRRPGRRTGDALVRALGQILRPVLGPASEKADLLVEHMARAHQKRLEVDPAGLAEAVRRLRAHFSDDEIRAGAEALVAQLRGLHDGRETVT